jgi:hypothetical protein
LGLKNQIKTKQSLGKTKNKLSQRAKKKVAKANPPKPRRQRQTRNKTAQGKGHQKTQCIIMEPKKKIVFLNNLLFSFTNVYSEKELMKSILITLRIIICKHEKGSSKHGFKRSILPFNLLRMWGSLNIELN